MNVCTIVKCFEWPQVWKAQHKCSPVTIYLTTTRSCSCCVVNNRNPHTISNPNTFPFPSLLHSELPHTDSRCQNPEYYPSHSLSISHWTIVVVLQQTALKGTFIWTIQHGGPCLPFGPRQRLSLTARVETRGILTSGNCLLLLAVRQGQEPWHCFHLAHSPHKQHL